jgi:DMSO/TMAO reductase YedYZ heme-binding membrane subunit
MLLVFAALTLPFLKELVRAFGKPFLSIHHTFAAVGLALITLHPVLFAVESSSAYVFVPTFSSWFLFWAFGGQVALPMLYVAFAAALLRRKAVTHWRPFHMLIYVALFFGIVHANLLGQSFRGSIVIVAIYDVLFAASMGVFIFKRYQNYRLRKRIREKSLEQRSH